MEGNEKSNRARYEFYLEESVDVFQMVDIRRGLGLESISQRKGIVEAFIALVSPCLAWRAGGGR